MKIRAIVKKPGCSCIVRKISNTKKGMQKLCGGYFDTMDFADGCVIVFGGPAKTADCPLIFGSRGSCFAGLWLSAA